MHDFGEEGKLARDSGLALHLLIGLFVAGYAASSSLAREMRSGTASAVLSKPVSRETFFLAKFAGVTLVVLAFSLCAMSATMLAERAAEKYVATGELTGYRADTLTGGLLFAAPFAACLVAGIINYLAKRPFESTAFGLVVVSLLLVFVAGGFFDEAGRTAATLDYRVDWRLLPAGILVTMALVVVAAVAIALSTRLTTVPTLSLCSVLLVTGLMSDYLFGGHGGAAAFIYKLVPNWQHFWMSDALTGGGRIPTTYILQTAFYAAVYTVGILCLGAASFRHAEVK